MKPPNLYGIVAEFESPAKLYEAAKLVRDHGYTKFEVYSPYPIKELDEVVPGSDPVAMIVLGGGILGGLTAWCMQYFIPVYDYPINVGGRPLNSWPAFVPIIFELTVLFASCAAFFGMLWLAGLPLLHHPMFNLKRFAAASKDHFFLCIEARDLMFAVGTARECLSHTGALHVWEVEDE